MSKTETDHDGARLLADLGFEKLAAQFADEAARALAAAQAMAGRLPKTQEPALEPSNIYVPVER